MSNTLKVLLVKQSERQLKSKKTRVSPRNTRKNQKTLSRPKSKIGKTTCSNNIVSKETCISETTSDFQLKANSFDMIEAIESSKNVNDCEDDSFISALDQLKFPESVKGKLDTSNFLIKRRVNLKIRLVKKFVKKEGKTAEEN